MKKISILAIIVFTFMMVIPTVKAYEVLTVSATESSSGKISVSGTVQSEMVAVAIMVYDATGENLVTMETTQVNDDNTFSSSINLDSGTYVVKVADYQGGEYKTITVSPGSNSTSTSAKTPNTFDNIILYLIIGLVGIIGLSSLIVYLKKTKMIRI